MAYHAVRLSGIKPGGTAAVFGSGPIGLVTTAALKAAGAEKVFVVEPAAVRKAKAPGAGADEVLDPTEVNVPDAIRDLTGGAAPTWPSSARASTPCSDRPIGSVRPGGTVVNVAIWGHEARVAVNELVFAEINLIGTLAYCEDHPATIGLLQDKKVDATQFITGRIGLDDLVARASGADRQQGGERQDPRHPEGPAYERRRASRGAGRGSGEGSRCGWPRDGHAVAVSDVNKAGAEAVAEEITSAGGRAIAVSATSPTATPCSRWSTRSRENWAASTSWSPTPASLRSRRCWT